MAANPFTDRSTIAATLYATQTRLQRRIRALKRAKICGDDPIQKGLDLALQIVPRPAAVLDLACGLGSSTAKILDRLTYLDEVWAVDLSPAMLAATMERCASDKVRPMCADFHSLPFEDRTFDLALAAFCLYHSERPQEVCAQIARCLRKPGIAILVTKSRSSYSQIDELLQLLGLRHYRSFSESLYGSFSSEQAEQIVAGSMDVLQVHRELHQFMFRRVQDLADYILTSPNYLSGSSDEEQLSFTASLASGWPAGGLTATSEVCIVVAGKR